VYYTAVQSFHTDPSQPITGCVTPDGCSKGTTPLGAYPASFLQAVREQGAGRITSGPYAGKYLTWDSDAGYAVDTAARAANGDLLTPFVSAEVDGSIPLGTGMVVQSCGLDADSGGVPDTAVCARIKAARWVADDRSGQTPGGRELGLYIGEENGPNFDITSPLVIDDVNAQVSFAQAPPAGSWSLAVYYTAVESFHGGPSQTVSGCPVPDCSKPTDLGSYPSSFVQAVKDQGAGHITSGPHAGRYLTWDSATGFAVDTAPRDESGEPLQSFVSVASDESIPLGTTFKVLGCGVDATSRELIEPSVCSRFRAANWVVDVRNGQPRGTHEVDLYVGEESGPDFQNSSPLAIDNVQAQTTLK
jgi:hypothetical protein